MRKEKGKGQISYERGRAEMTDLIIDRLIYRRMRDSEQVWRTPVEVKKGQNKIEFKKDAIAAL